MSDLRILLVNDDGISAPGLARLEAAARLISSDVWTVAPTVEHSGASSAISVNRPLRAHRLADQRFSVDGTPVDCVILAFDALLPAPPGLVLSGVNRGANLGADVRYSGTCAAAIEAATRGAQARAFSLCVEPGSPDRWDCVDRYIDCLVWQLAGIRSDGVLSVNFPAQSADAVTGVHAATLARARTPRTTTVSGVDPRGNSYWWLKRDEDLDPLVCGTDFTVISAGGISMTSLPSNPRETSDQHLLGDVAAEFWDLCQGTTPSLGVP